MDWYQTLLLICISVGILLLAISNPQKKITKVEVEVDEKEIILEPIMTVEHAYYLYRNGDFTEEEKAHYCKMELKYRKQSKRLKEWENKFNLAFKNMKHRELYDLCLEYQKSNINYMVPLEQLKPEQAIEEIYYEKYCFRKLGYQQYGFGWHDVMNEIKIYILQNPYNNYVRETNNNLVKNIIEYEVAKEYHYECDLEKEYKYLIEVLNKFRFKGERKDEC